MLKFDNRAITLASQAAAKELAARRKEIDASAVRTVTPKTGKFHTKGRNSGKTTTGRGAK